MPQHPEEIDGARIVWERRWERWRMPVLAVTVMILTVIVIGLLIPALSGSEEEEEPAVEPLEMAWYTVFPIQEGIQLDVTRPSFCCQAKSTSIEMCEKSQKIEGPYACRLTSSLHQTTRNTCSVRCLDVKTSNSPK